MTWGGNYKYIYDGPVLEFGRLVMERWLGETIAPSKNKARSNLAYQYKKQNSRLPGTKIELPGEIKLIKED